MNNIMPFFDFQLLHLDVSLFQTVERCGLESTIFKKENVAALDGEGQLNGVSSVRTNHAIDINRHLGRMLYILTSAAHMGIYRKRGGLKRAWSAFTAPAW